MLSTGTDAVTAKTLWINPEKGNFFMNAGKPVDATFERPDKYDTVFKIVLKKQHLFLNSLYNSG
jgi:hypothetical protein